MNNPLLKSFSFDLQNRSHITTRSSRKSLQDPNYRFSTSGIKTRFSRISDSYTLKDHQITLHLQLLNYGLTEQVSLFLIYSSQARTLAQVLDLLIFDNEGNMNHLFIPKTKGADNSSQNAISQQCCHICGAHFSKHNLIMEADIQKAKHIWKKVLEQTQGSENILGNVLGIRKSIEEERFDCILCYNSTKLSQIFQIDRQKHDVCLPCLDAYLTSEILNAKVEFIQCPGHCEEELTEETIRLYVNNQTFFQYQYFQQKIQIEKDPSIWFCPVPSCSFQNQFPQEIQGDDDDLESQLALRKAYCDQCNFEICAKCRKEFHGSIENCEVFAEKQLQKWADVMDVKPCPKCQILVEQNEGCNHMKCSKCTYEWCWICTKEYQPDHFNFDNINGCPGLMFTQTYKGVVSTETNANTMRNLSICSQIIVLLIYLIILPILLILSGLIMYKLSFRYEHHHTYRCIRAMYCHNNCCGVILAIFIWPILILVSPFIGLVVFFQLVKQLF